MMESLEFWLTQVSNNSDGKILTHWEIEALFTQITKSWIPPALEVQILPLLGAIRKRGETGHRYKANVAIFALRLIKDFKEKFYSDPF